jgi:hypothetical protein
MPRIPEKHRRAHKLRRPPQATPMWIDVPAVARVDASSEDPQFTIGHAFSGMASVGWRAANPGAQVIDGRFRKPRDLTRIRLVFEDPREARTQEFTISWSSRRGEMHGEVVRQQFNFSPGGATQELEDYRVELRAVETLRIRIVPDIGGGSAMASLRQCRIA